MQLCAKMWRTIDGPIHAASERHTLVLCAFDDAFCVLANDIIWVWRITHSILWRVFGMHKL